jgi:hypothetical protein
VKDRYRFLKRRINEVIIEKENVENELAKAKIRWADIELKHDNLQFKLNHTQSRLQVIE